MFILKRKPTSRILLQVVGYQLWARLVSNLDPLLKNAPPKKSGYLIYLNIDRDFCDLTMKRDLLNIIILVISLMLGATSTFAQDYVEKKTAFNSERIKLSNFYLEIAPKPILPN